MGPVSDKRRVEVVQMLREAVDALADAVGSGRLGFDHAVREYVERTDNELSRAFQGYVQALFLDRQSLPAEGEDERPSADEIRRVALIEIADRFQVSEVTAFVEACLESQDKRLSIGDTLWRQSRQLRRSE